MGILDQVQCSDKTPVTFIMIHVIPGYATDSYSESHGPSPDPQNRSKFHFNIILQSTSFSPRRFSLSGSPT